MTSIDHSEISLHCMLYKRSCIESDGTHLFSLYTTHKMNISLSADITQSKWWRREDAEFLTIFRDARSAVTGAPVLGEFVVARPPGRSPPTLPAPTRDPAGGTGPLARNKRKVQLLSCTHKFGKSTFTNKLVLYYFWNWYVIDSHFSLLLSFHNTIAWRSLTVMWHITTTYLMIINSHVTYHHYIPDDH